MWLYNPETNELEEKEDVAAVDLSGTSGVPTGGGPAQSTSALPTSTNQFTDINKYLNVNQPQAEALGEKVAGGIEKTTQDASQALDQGEAEFNKQVEAQSPTIADEQVKNLATDPNALTAYVNDPKNVEAFKKAASGQYSGPNAFSDITGYQDLVGKVGKASQASELAKTSGGRQGLIKDVYSKPERAKAGMLGLDEALVKQTPGAIGKIQEKAKQAEPLADRITQIEESAGKAAQAKKDEVSARAKQIQDQFLGESGAYEKLKSGLGQKLQDVSTSSEKARDTAQKFISRKGLEDLGIISYVQPPAYPSGNLPPKQLKVNVQAALSVPQEALDQLGITKSQYIDLISKMAPPSQFAADIDPAWQTVDPGNYAQFGTPTSAGIDLGSVASSQDRDTLAALEKLFSDSVNENYIPASEKSFSGPADLTDFNYQELLNYLSNPKYLPWKTSTSVG